MLSVLLSCTPTPAPSPTSLSFNPKNVYELTLTHSDPQTGDTWLGTFRKTTHHKKPTWEITTAPSHSSASEPGADRLANESFLNHLLDSLTQLTFSPQPVPRDIHEHLESFGLQPPRFALQWKAHNKFNDNFNDKVHEIQIGSPHPHHSENVYTTLDGKTVWIAQGSALKLLSYIHSFETLRRKHWSLLRPDEIDEITLTSANLKKFYTQRDGNVWTDRRHTPISKNMDAFLEHLIHVEAEDILTSSSKHTKSIQKNLTQRPLYQIHLSRRSEVKITYSLTRIQGKVYGMNTGRPGAIFAFKPEYLAKLEEHL